MRVLSTVVTATLAISVGALTACGTTGAATTTDEQSYQISQSIQALVVEARAAGGIIETGDGPVTVKETYRDGDDKPAPPHGVDGSTLRLTDTGCRTDEVRCDVEFRVHLPAKASARVTTEAGAVRMTGLAGNVTVTTQAGVFE